MRSLTMRKNPIPIKNSNVLYTGIFPDTQFLSYELGEWRGKFNWMTMAHIFDSAGFYKKSIWATNNTTNIAYYYGYRFEFVKTIHPDVYSSTIFVHPFEDFIDGIRFALDEIAESGKYFYELDPLLFLFCPPHYGDYQS